MDPTASIGILVGLALVVYFQANKDNRTILAVRNGFLIVFVVGAAFVIINLLGQS